MITIKIPKYEAEACVAELEKQFLGKPVRGLLVKLQEGIDNYGKEDKQQTRG